MPLRRWAIKAVDIISMGISEVINGRKAGKRAGSDSEVVRQQQINCLAKNTIK